VTTASIREGFADSTSYEGGGSQKIDLVLSEIKVDNYDGIFLIGGRGALDDLDNETVYGIIKEAKEKDKLFGAICISPRILVKTGVLFGKRATGWNGDGDLENIFKNSSTEYVCEPVVVDGRIITAEGPGAAKEFGETIAKQLKG